jgi:M6 family metalloprotease-like protein
MSRPLCVPVRLAGAVLATLFVGACDGSTRPPTEPLAPAVASVTVTPESSTVNLESGPVTQFFVVLKDSAGQVLTGRTVFWSSGNTARALVGGNGVVTAVGSGPVTITATAEGKSGSATLTVVSAPTIETCKLPRTHGSVAFGFPKPVERLRSVGTVRATVIFVDFSDAVATRTPAQVLGILSPVSESFFSAVSYGAMTFVLEPTLQWFRMSKPSTQYGWPSAVTYASHVALLQEAADLAAPSTDYSQTDLLVVITNPDAGAINNGPALVANAGFGVTVPGRGPIGNGTNSGRDLNYWGGTWLNHEVGHLLSLPDLYDYVSPSGFRHTGEWSLMGLINGRGPEWTAFERWQLGWLSDSQVHCAGSGTTELTVSPIESAGGLKAVMVPLSRTRALVVESRRAIGFDAGLTQPGALVYLIDTGVASGAGTMRVLPYDDGDAVKLMRTLVVGGVLGFEGVTVEVLAGGAGGDLVRVGRP